MLTLFVLAPILLVVLAISLILRLLALPFRHLRPHRRFLGRSPYPGAYARGFYPRPRFGGLLSIAFLFALDRLFGRRW